MAIKYDPNFTSGLEYALSVAGGENVPGMIAPGVSYSSEFPMGYTADGLLPTPMPTPMPRPILEDFQRVDPFTALNTHLSDSLANPTSAMYSTDVGTGASMGLGAPMPISAPNTFPTGEQEFTNYANPFNQSDPSSIADQMALTNLYDGMETALDAARGVDAYNEATDSSVLSEIKSFLGGSQEQKMKDAMVDRLKAELKERQVGGASQSPFKFAKQGGGGGKTVRQGSAQTNAMDNAAIAREKAAAMNVLYGGAGSSFESGRNEYTESGQYEIDKAKRDAEFDAMREQERINAGLPYVRYTPEETQELVRQQREKIGFGGAMTPREGYTPFDFTNIQSILNNLG